MAIFTIPHPRRHVESRFIDRLLLVICSMSQKQGPPPPGWYEWPAHILSGCDSLVNLSAAALLSALIAAIPGASNIDNLETQHKSRFTHLHSTLLPQVTGQRNRRRLASPLHGTLTPGRISVGRPLSGSRTGVSLSLTESSQNSLPRTAFGRMGTAGHLILGRFYGSFWGRLVHFLCIPASTCGLGASSGVACLSRREAPSETYLNLGTFNFQGERIPFTGTQRMEQIEQEYYSI